MDDPHWISYVAMATGVFGALMGVLGYRKASALKHLDMRIEIRKARNEAHHEYFEVNDLGLTAAELRRRAAEPAHTYLAPEPYTDDRVEKLKANIDPPRFDYDRLSTKELEDKLVLMHKTLGVFAILREEYEKEIQNRKKKSEHGSPEKLTGSSAAGLPYTTAMQP